MAKKLSVRDLLYPGGVPRDQDYTGPGLIFGGAPELQPRKGAPRDLNARARRKPSPSLRDYAATAGDVLFSDPRNSPAAVLGSKAVDYVRSATPQSVKGDVARALTSGRKWLGDENTRLRAAPVGESLRLLKESFVDPLTSPFEVFQSAAEARAAGDEDTARRTAAVVPLAGASALGAVYPMLGRGSALTRGAAMTDLAARAEPRPAYNVRPVGDMTEVARVGVEPRVAPAARDATSMRALRAIAHDPEQSDVLRVANEASMAARGVPYDVNAPTPVSSLARQGGIARAFQEALTDNPAYKHALFERYGQLMPEVVEQARAQNADQLMEAAYNKLGDEVTQQFDRLPLRMRYHQGSGEYPSPNAMMRDVLGEGNLNVFSGGEPHDMLSKVDPATSLTANEMFRAVHDYMGHVVPGSMFGAPGEEVAYAAHARTLSPLAQLALLSETRGQNSWVNYGTANADLIDQMNRLKRQRMEREVASNWVQKYPNDRWAADARRALSDLPGADEIRSRLHELGGQFQYAPQRGVLLPPEYLDVMSPGGTPDWLRPLLTVEHPTSARGVHFSRAEDLAATDPSFYGTGAKSGERPMVLSEGLPNRTYFYSGEPGTVTPEESVGRVGKHVYEANLGNLYDINADPVGLLKLSRAYNLDDYKPLIPEFLAYTGGVEGKRTLPDLERMVRDYGYSGYISDFGAPRRAAALFEPVSGLKRLPSGAPRYASGGSVS